MNFHALAPKRYKRSVLSVIHRACSTWKHFSKSLQRAKQILEKNNYPPAFYEAIIKSTLQDIIMPPQPQLNDDVQQPPGETSVPSTEEAKTTCKHMLLIQYRGKCIESYTRALHRIDAPCTVVMTLRKLKTVMPSIKPPVEKSAAKWSCIQTFMSRLSGLQC